MTWWSPCQIDADPVIPGPPRFLNVTGFRDPLVTFDADKGHFRMLLGSGIKGKFGTVLEYTAPAVSGPWNYSYVTACAVVCWRGVSHFLPRASKCAAIRTAGDRWYSRTQTWNLWKGWVTTGNALTPSHWMAPRS